MKARLSGILVIVLLASFNFPAADAAAKSGMACKKVGSVAIAGAYKYTCIKSGKKTVWNKGAKVPVVKPTSVATFSPNPDPHANPDPQTNTEKPENPHHG